MPGPKLAKTKIKSYTFEAVIEPDEFADGTKAFHAFIPTLKSCRSWGLTPEEALENLGTAAKLMIELMIEQGEPLPQEAKISKQPLITIHHSS
jgi:predicted RNase H-like HicB family nuclease